jgi:hypothetical protein
MAAIEAITSVSTRDTIGRSQPDRARADRLRDDQIASDDTRTKQIEQDRQEDRARVEKAESDRELQRTQAKKEAEQERVVEQEVQREAARLEARKQADLERLARTDQNREAQRALQSQLELSRIEGVNAYRAQNQRVQALSPTDRLSVQQISTEPARTLRSQLAAFEATRIDKIDLSEIARARLEGAVGLTIIQPTAPSGAQLTA